MLAAVVLARDVAGIEKLSKLLMPVLVIVVLFLVYGHRNATGQTKDFFFQVDWSRLWDGRLWGFAFGQAFYTLAIGQGYLVTYGSFIPRKTHVPRACLTVAGVETGVALSGRLDDLSLRIQFGMSQGQGGYSVRTLPLVFEQMPGGSWLAILRGYFSWPPSVLRWPVSR
ncbi:MAG: hypothetical protein U5K56_02950 [Halioglobus sp.]|nr:hypothetical protein [Halioglobus sp.]